VPSLEAVGRFPETQLVLSVGKNIKPDNLRPIPSNAIIVSTAPQIELLKRATLCITHAGLNTALEALAQGVPMVAIPIGFDQPGVPARIAYHGVGEFVEIGDLTAERLSELIQRVRTNPSYRDKARYFQKVIAQTQGLGAAVHSSLSITRSQALTIEHRVCYLTFVGVGRPESGSPDRQVRHLRGEVTPGRFIIRS